VIYSVVTLCVHLEMCNHSHGDADLPFPTHTNIHSPQLLLQHGGFQEDSPLTTAGIDLHLWSDVKQTINDTQTHNQKQKCLTH